MSPAAGDQAAKELHKSLLDVFPDTFVTPITAETQKTWMLQDPSRVKVGDCGLV
jgi:hypothetical protein